ncbi:MAG: biopolymer transport protein [Circular genetic element sp.]|nr:MAG: biopolymer transport protein [Circular genetic element sp.]
MVFSIYFWFLSLSAETIASFMGKRHLSKRLSEEPTVNLTPLIDVVFVILIMFIVIAPLLELDRIQLADSKGQHSGDSISVQESSPIAIHVRQDNSIWFSGNVVAITDLPDLLKLAKVNFPGIRPQLFHDRKAHFGTYQSVKNAAEEAGFDQLDIVLKP